MGDDELACEDMLLLISRSLDGDLRRTEMRQLCLHIAKCEPCRVQMAEMVVLESNAAELSRLYETQSLDDKFNKKLKEAIRSIKRKSG